MHSPPARSDRKVDLSRLELEPFECWIEVDEDGGALVHVGGELDRSNSPEFERRLLEAQEVSSTVLVDTQELSFMDCAGLTSLAHAPNSATSDSTLVLVGCTGQVKRLLELTGPPCNVEVADARSRAPTTT